MAQKPHLLHYSYPIVHRYLDIYYKSIVFSKVFFYSYATGVTRIVRKRIVLKLVFISKFQPAIHARLVIDFIARNCSITFCDREHSHYVCYTLLCEIDHFVCCMYSLCAFMVRVLQKSGVLLSVGILTKIVYFTKLFSRRCVCEWR